MSRYLPFVLFLLVSSTAAANDVAVEVKGGSLVIKGDDDGNAVTLDQVGLGTDSVRVAPGGGTTVNGAAGAQVFGGLVAGAKITLAGGADLLELESMQLNGNVGIKAGDGSDRVNVLDATLQGPAKIDLGAGDNALTLCDAAFPNDVSIKIGKQTGGFVTATCPGATGNVTTNEGGSVFLMHNDTFGGSLAVKAASAVHVGVVDDVAVAGALAFKNVPLVALCYSTLSGAASVKLPKILGSAGGNVSCEGGATEAFADGNTALAMSGSTVGDAFTVKSAAGGDGIVVTGTSVQEGMTVAMGSGLNFLFLDGVQVGTDLVAKAGKDDDDFFGDNLQIGENATVKYGAGANVIDFGTSLVGENLTIATGAGNDTITTNGVGVGGTKTIKNGKGVDTLN